MIITIKIRSVNNGYLVKFYRGVWDWPYARYIAKTPEEIDELIKLEFERKLIDTSRQQVE